MNSAASMGTQAPDDTTVSLNRSTAVCQTEPTNPVRKLTPRDEETNLKLLADDALADRIRFYRDRNEQEHLKAAQRELGRRHGNNLFDALMRSYE